MTLDHVPGDHEPVLAALRVCPLCRTEYDPPLSRCSLDGASLCDADLDDEENTPPLGTAVGKPSLGELGPYRLTSILGEGSMAVVYAAEHRTLGRRAAIKRLREGHDPETTRRFLGEARAVASIQHPNLVTIYDVVAEPGQAYLVMELLDGRDLRTVLRTGPLSLERALRIAAEMCAALTPVHARGIVHRDVKPANVFLCTIAGREQVKMLDFGAARFLGREARAVERRLRADSTTLGSPVYMSPEQVAGEALDARSDLYSIGVVLHEMLAGAPPFLGGTTSDVLLQHLHQGAPPLAERGVQVPEAVELLLARCLAKSPDDRPASAASLERELRALGAPMGVEPSSVPPPSPAPPAPSRFLSAVAALGVLGLVGALGVARWSRPPAAPPALTPPLTAAVRPAVAPAAVAPVVAPAAAAPHPVRVESAPGGAAATTDGLAPCSTPCTLALGPAPTAIVVRHAGYRDATVTVGPEQSVVRVVLAPLAARRPGAPRRAMAPAAPAAPSAPATAIPSGEIINPFQQTH